MSMLLNDEAARPNCIHGLPVPDVHNMDICTPASYRLRIYPRKKATLFFTLQNNLAYNSKTEYSFNLELRIKAIMLTFSYDVYNNSTLILKNQHNAYQYKPRIYIL